jgi:hypothetical protein
VQVGERYILDTQKVIDDNTTIARSEGLVEAGIDDEIVMMSIEQGDYYGLDSVASRIWQLLEQPQTVSKITAQLMAEYEVAAEQCRADTGAFVREMVEHGLVSAPA